MTVVLMPSNARYARVATDHLIIITGSVHINLLTGRVLFKDVHYYCRDYSVR